MSNIMLIIVVLTGVMFLVNLIRNDVTLITYGIGFILSLFLFFFLKKTKSYLLPAIVGAIALLALNIFNLFLYSHFYHFVDYLWMIFQILFVFFLFSERIGMINFAINIITIAVLYYIKNEIGYTELKSEYYSFLYINFIINLLVITSLLTYLIHHMLNQVKENNLKLVVANTEIAHQNEEKTVMLKEIHHRVKNNLQVISSLLRLQAAEIEEKSVLHHFEDAVNRVSAMAMIHEKMYQTDSLAKINLEGYVKELASSLIKSAAPNKSIELDIQSGVVKIDVKTLVPIALILNELISNSLEHAFAKRDFGAIKFTAEEKENKLIITYRDNGMWKTPKKEKSFGLELIETFTEQLDGSYRREEKEGTFYEFTFLL